MKFKTILIWSLVNGKEHKSLNGADKKITQPIALTEALFPGIDYFSLSGHSELMENYVIPTLKKRFPDLSMLPEEAVVPDAMVEILEVIPCRGGAWRNESAWNARFREFLAAA